MVAYLRPNDVQQLTNVQNAGRILAAVRLMAIWLDRGVAFAPFV
jgi:hypothetical protein